MATSTLTLKLISRTALTDAVSEFVFQNVNGAPLPSFTAGSHIKFQTPAGERSYSLINLHVDESFEAPSHYRIAVQLDPQGQGGSSHMHSLEPGATLQAVQPHNNFKLEDGGTPAILIAGGIGVTPMISMAHCLQSKAVLFSFHYAARSKDAMAWREVLAQRFADNLQLHFDDEPATAMNLATVIRQMSDKHHLYVCGPKGMIKAAKKIAEDAAIDKSRIHFELFFSPAPTKIDMPFEVVIQSSGKSFTVPAGKTIIEVLEANGVDLIYDCQRGDCGICQTTVIEGTPDHRDVVLSEAEKQEGKLMQICVSRSKTPKLVLDL